MRPRRDRPPRPRRLRGRARRAASRTAGAATSCARPTTSARARDRRAAARASTTSRVEPRSCASAPTRRRSAALSLALAQAGIGIRALVPRTATLEELFFRLTEGEPRAAGRARAPTRRPVACMRRPLRDRLRAGSCASCAPRSAPTSGSARRVARAADLRRRAARSSTGGPKDIAVRALRARVRPRDPARRACSSARSGFFPLITALVAGDIVAAEDGNGTLKTILTRSVDAGRSSPPRCSPRSPTRSPRSWSSASSRSSAGS